MLIVENNSKIKCSNSQSITTFASLFQTNFAHKLKDGNVVIDISDCGTGGGLARREDFLCQIGRAHV